jgi:hypothetical protein
MICFDLKREKRVRAIRPHLQFPLRAIIFELPQKVSIRRSGQHAFERFLAEGDAAPFDALQVNPVTVGCIHTYRYHSDKNAKSNGPKLRGKSGQGGQN